jgi:hypothetical protein
MARSRSNWTERLPVGLPQQACFPEAILSSGSLVPVPLEKANLQLRASRYQWHQEIAHGVHP